MQYDKRAVKILFDTYWNSGGWKQLASAPTTPPDDLAFAIRSGLMFLPCKFSHDGAIERVLELRSEIFAANVGSAFIGSLFKNQQAARSALGSFAVALNMPAHRFSPAQDAHYCSICGAYESKVQYDLNVLNFERHKWGGVRHSDPFYIAFDLERFKFEGGELPSDQDREIFDSLLGSIERMPSAAKLSDLIQTIKPILKGNDSQRRTVIEILGIAGVLRVPDRIGFLRSFPLMTDREHTPWSKDDWGYPTRWWRGGSGIDREAVSFWFGQ